MTWHPYTCTPSWSDLWPSTPEELKRQRDPLGHSPAESCELEGAKAMLWDPVRIHNIWKLYYVYYVYNIIIHILCVCFVFYNVSYGSHLMQYIFIIGFWLVKKFMVLSIYIYIINSWLIYSPQIQSRGVQIDPWGLAWPGSVSMASCPFDWNQDLPPWKGGRWDVHPSVGHGESAVLLGVQCVCHRPKALGYHRHHSATFDRWWAWWSKFDLSLANW